ncbi:MAG: flavodoxin, partial [Deltaproteobacteria bacterium]|nr:flavodoxin [Deltaproteobacteria bacterium]
MNRILALILMTALFSASGMAAQDKPVIDPAKTLIAYYSWSGNTRELALQIQRLTGGTLFEIVPETAYPSNYNDCVNQAREETRKEFQPPRKNGVAHMEQYEVIFVGSP